MLRYERAWTRTEWYILMLFGKLIAKDCTDGLLFLFFRTFYTHYSVDITTVMLRFS